MVSADAAEKARIIDANRIVTRCGIQAHSSNGGGPYHVTKVPHQFGMRRWAAICCAAFFAVRAGAEVPSQRPAEALYLQLGQVGLDATRVYQVRGAALERSTVHITLEDGTIAFTQDVMGRVTGAFFEGE